MADNVLGLLFEISADPSQAEAAIAKFNEATGNALADAAGKTKPFDDALLSNRESVRLLSEELGVRLPCAVSGAIAEMVPAIGGLGGILLAVFAVEKAVEWGKVLNQKIEEARATAKEAVADLDGAAAAALKHAQGEAKKLFAEFKDTATGRESLREIEDRLQTLSRYRAAFEQFSEFQANAMDERWRIIGEAAKEGITTLDQAWQKEKEYLALQKQAREQMDKLWSEADKKQEKLEATWGRWPESLQDHFKAVQKAFDQGMNSMHQNALKVEKDLDAVAASSNRAAKAEIDFALRLEEYGIVEQRQAPQIITSTEQQAEHTKHLSNARKELIWVTQELHKVEEAFKNALRGDFEALHQAEEWGAGIGERFAGLIAGTKAAAEVRGAFDAAQAIEYWATFIASWGTDTAAGAAAVQYSLAAAEMFKVAGGAGSSAHIGGGGGGGGGTQSSYGRGGPGGAGGSGQGTLHITYIQNAPMFTPQTALQTIAMLAPVFSSAVKSGQITLTATNAITNGPKQTGR